MLYKGSRYAAVPQDALVAPDGRVVRYITARLIPETRAVAGHRVLAGERLDHIAHAHYRDPERFWRLCDANRAAWPADLLEPGRIIGVPAAEG